MKYFVTGATGFIGGRVTRLLAEAGHDVVALVRHGADGQALAQAGVRVVEGDLTLKESMREPMRGADGVFHLGAWYRIGGADQSRAEAVNVGGTYNVLELMRELEIPKGVYTSSLIVFGDTHGRTVDERYRHDGPWLTEYERTKWKAHYQVAEPLMRAGLPLVTLLPGIAYGPGDRSAVRSTVVRYLRGKLPMVPGGTAYCWGHVDDVARAHLAAMDKGSPGEAYIVAGPAHSLRQVFETAASITGIPAPRMTAAPWILRALATAMRAVEASAPCPRPTPPTRSASPPA